MYHIMDDFSLAINNHEDGAVLSIDAITNA